MFNYVIKYSALRYAAYDIEDSMILVKIFDSDFFEKCVNVFSGVDCISVKWKKRWRLWNRWTKTPVMLFKIMVISKFEYRMSHTIWPLQVRSHFNSRPSWVQMRPNLYLFFTLWTVPDTRIHWKLSTEFKFESKNKSNESNDE